MTYSIVARDPATGELGVAVQTHQVAVGAIVPWVKAGVGAVATQSFANINFGPRVLALLETGLSAEAALNAVIAADTMPTRRQLAVIAADGQTATFTGVDCIPFAGHASGENYSVQANMMLNDTVPAAMAAAFEGSEGPLAVRLMRALEAAEAEGGDIRGMQSAALLVRAPGPLSHTWDLRIDNHPDPLTRLQEIVEIRLAGLIVSPEPGKAATSAELLVAYEEANELAGSDEQTFWFAVRTLTPTGETARAAEMLKPLFERAPRWKELLVRLETPEADALKSHFTR